MSDLLKTVLIVEGGAMRSVFSAGLLDGFLMRNFNPFDYYIGVSAGASNLAAFLAKDIGKSLQIYLDLASSKKFINLSRFLKGGHLLNLDWLCQTVFEKNYLTKSETYYKEKPLYVGTTDVASGNDLYTRLSHENMELLLKASMALPYLYKGFPIINGQSMTDGGIACNLPIAEAIKRGAKQIMVVRSRHQTYTKKDTFGHKFIRWQFKNYPMLVKAMESRVKKHEDGKKLIANPPENVTIVEICPPVEFKVGRFSKNKKQLLVGYDAGFEMADMAIQQWQ